MDVSKNNIVGNLNITVETNLHVEDHTADLALNLFCLNPKENGVIRKIFDYYNGVGLGGLYIGSYYFEIKEANMDENLKSSILKAAWDSGCDLDGDVVNYGGKLYYVHVCDDIVKEIRDDN